MARQALAVYNIGGLLEKMGSPDKDYRFMAVNDIMTQLQNDTVKLDDDSERKVVRMLLKLLEDKNGEVQNLAVKCLGLLIFKVKPFRVEAIVEDLCRSIMSDKEPLRDISNIGLKTIISQFPLPSPNLTKLISEYIIDHLIIAVQKDHVAIQLEGLEMLADMLHKFGSVLPSQFMMNILNTVIPKFSASRQAVRKRAIVLCSILTCYCDNSLYTVIADHLYTGLAVKTNGSDTSRTYVQCIAAICSQSGRRFGGQIDRFFPLIQSCSQEDDDDTREYCLQAFQLFVQRCPKEITPYISVIMEICLLYLTYDPNYNYEDDDEDPDNMNQSMEDESETYSDDDDMTWRVRRACIKCLEAIILNRYELLPDLYQHLAPALIARFKERDENVKADIFQALICLLKQTTAAELTTSEGSPVHLLELQIPSIVSGVCIQMIQKSIKTRQACFQLLKVLCNVIPGALTPYIADLIAGIRYSLQGSHSSNSMKIDTLSFIHCLITTHNPEVFHDHIDSLLTPILKAVQSEFFKTVTEAMIVLRELVKVMRPLDTVSSFDYTSFVTDIYKCTLARVQGFDVEVKQEAILTMGQIVSNFGDYLQEELYSCMPIFLDRLKNETTRLTTIKALINITESALLVDLHIVNDAIPILGSFLRQNQRVLKLSTLRLLDQLIKIHYHCINVELLQQVVVEVPALLDESDLLVSQWTLVFLESLTRYHPSALKFEVANIFCKIMQLLKSPFLQGPVLVSMIHFLQGVVKCNLQDFGVQEILQLLSQPVFKTSPIVEEIQKPVYYSLAKCVAAVTVVCKNQAYAVTNSFLQTIQCPQMNSHHLFSLLVIGEIGREIDLMVVEQLRDAILESFMANSEEVKFAASYALAGVSIGNLQENLPFILLNLTLENEHHYLFLSTLNEIITTLSSSQNGIEQLLPFIPNLWEQLLPFGQSHEEGIRNIVAECLGKSTFIDPANLLLKLQKYLQHNNPLMRATAVTAIKFLITDKPHPVDPLLYQRIKEFLNKLQDPDATVRRAALVLFNSAAHNKPSLIRDLLDSVLPQLYNATLIDQSLIKEVEMGPFKHVVDDGLDIRKAAYECMYTLLSCCVEKINIYEFVNYLEGGLKDHYDIKMLTYLMVGRLAQLRPLAVLQEMDKLIEPLQATCVGKVKANSVHQEHKRLEELKKSAVRAVVELLKIPEADKNAALREAKAQIQGSELGPIFEAIQSESNGCSGGGGCTQPDLL